MRFRFASSLRVLKLPTLVVVALGSAMLASACGGAAPAPTPTVAAAPSPGVTASPTRPNNLASPVTAPSPTTAAAPTASAAGGTPYTIESGDTLLGISEKQYGDATLWRRIFDANKDVIADPDALSVGTKIQIPPKP